MRPPLPPNHNPVRPSCMNTQNLELNHNEQNQSSAAADVQSAPGAAEGESAGASEGHPEEEPEELRAPKSRRNP